MQYRGVHAEFCYNEFAYDFAHRRKLVRYILTPGS